MERIRRLREERGLTQVKLAVEADMNPATLNRIEMGKANPNLKTLERLADALGVRVAQLLEDDSPKDMEPSLPFEDQDGRRRDVFYAIWLEYVDRWAGHWEAKAERGELSREMLKEWRDSLTLIGQTTGRLEQEERRDYPGENLLSQDKFVWKATSRALGTMKVVVPAAKALFQESEFGAFEREQERIAREWSRAADG